MKCGHCRWFDDYKCKRFPKWEPRLSNEWCGEFKDRDWMYEVPVAKFATTVLNDVVPVPELPVVKRPGRPRKA